MTQLRLLQVFEVEERNLSEQQAVLPAQCSHLAALHTLRLDCFSEMKAFPLQVLTGLIPRWHSFVSDAKYCVGSRAPFAATWTTGVMSP